MSAALNRDGDRFRLPLPTATTPVIPAHAVVAEHAHNARYADPVWPLAAMIANPSASLCSVFWDRCPAAFHAELRLIAWTMLNGELRPTFLKARAAKLRSRLSGLASACAIADWMALARWLEARGIRSLAQCDTKLLHDYGLARRDSGTDRSCVQKTLGALTRLWAFDELSARPVGIGRPPWDQGGQDDYLPAHRGGTGENSTEPLAEGTIGPLLWWAMCVVEDLSEDILAAWAENRRLTSAAKQAPTTPDGAAALTAYLAPLLDTDAALPAAWNHGAPCLARTYIAGITGASLRDVDHLNERGRLTRAAAQRPGPCPMDLPVTGRINGLPWRESLDFGEAPTLMRHLGTATFIVCSYLTGARPEEVLAMRAGCCPDPRPAQDGALPRHLIHSSQFKTAADQDGNHLSAGIEREAPWVAIKPVVNAIRVLERMVPPGALLFDHYAHNVRAPRAGTGSMKPHGLRRRIEDFAAWANTQAVALALPEAMIQPDPHGAIATARFRRSLAWHIARRPGGLVALAIQYGHMRTTLNMQVSGGYASRGRGGIHDLIDVETALATAQTAAGLKDAFHSGAGVSGPAARAALAVAAQAALFQGQEVKADYARKYLARDGAVLYDNPHAFLICRYKQAQALCEREGTTPRREGCVRGCGNAVRTDEHAAGLRERAELLEKRAAHTPPPVAQRLLAAAAQARADAAAHDATRITIQQVPA